MSMTPYETLRGKINALLPERLTLGFGCEVKTSHELNGAYIQIAPGECTTHCCINDKRPHVVYQSNHCTASVHLDEKDITEILGPPLTLADILRAMHKKSAFRHITTNGEVFDPAIRECETVGRGFFLPIHLPVKDWPEETLNSIIGLL